MAVLLLLVQWDKITWGGQVLVGILQVLHERVGTDFQVRGELL